MKAAAPHPGGRWQVLLRHWSRDLQLLLFITLSLQIFRLLLIGWFGGQSTALTVGSLLAVAGNGLRYDVSTAALWVLPTYLLSFLALTGSDRFITRAHAVSAGLFAVFSVLVFGVDLVYFDEYNDQFNQHLFGLFHDDTLAILVTVWKEYHPLPTVAAVGLLAWGNLRLIRRWLTWQPKWLARLAVGGPGRRVAIGFAVFLLLAAAGRGGTLWGEPIRLKHAFVVDDLFLNRTVVNPFTALRYTLESHYRAQRRGGLAAVWPGGDVHTATAQVLGRQSAPGTDLDSLLAVEAGGPPRTPPRHVFLILNESHSGWTVLPSYRNFGFSPAVSALAERGLYFPNFIASSSGTIGSMNAIVTGLPDAGLNINYEVEALKPFPTGTAAIFKQLGYRTRFFYGGFLSWQRLDAFGHAQGFDEVYGGGSMRTGVRTNEWGVDDEALFEFVLRTVNDEAPSLNFILTTSNHPPYDLDLNALGFPFDTLPEPLRATKDETLKVLGHLWYSDRAIGNFVHKAEPRFSRSLFAVTGDHTARLGIRFPGDSVMEQVAVPLVLYGPEVLPEAATLPTPGSHIDLPATLVELAAPQGFRYPRFGRNLLAGSEGFGLGYGFIIGKDFIAADAEPPSLFQLAGQRTTPAASPNRVKSVFQRYNALRALSWYRARKGSKLP